MAAAVEFGGVLRTYVHVDGRVYGPEDEELPVEVARRIPNPKAWAKAPVLEEPAEAPYAGPAGPEVVLRRQLELVQAELDRLRAGTANTEPGESGHSSEPSVTTSEVLPPPQGGAGSGLTEWLAYAEQVGVQVPEESRAKRDDVVLYLERAGKPVERTPK